jgi:hypothetical protein
MLYNYIFAYQLISFKHFKIVSIQVVLSGNNTPNDSEENKRESTVTPEK